MPNYQNGKIYTIRSHKTTLIYVGSTTQELSARMSGHRKNFKQFNNGKPYYVSSFEILKFDDAYIELIEEYPCENKSQLHKREGHFIREMDCCNKRVAGRTLAEYKEDNKEKIKKSSKIYDEKNKDKIKDYHSQFYQDNKDKIKQKHAIYYQENKDKINQQINNYRELNKDKIKQTKQKYRELNKDKINKKRRQTNLEKKQQLEITN